MIGIDLFAGAGGMSLGAVCAGIDVKFAVEQDIHSSTTYQNNHPDSDLFVGDIREITNTQIKNIPRGSEETVVFGGPPCQGFSFSNTRTRGITNENNWLFREFVRFVRVWDPDYFVFENVRGILNTAGGLFLTAVLEEFQKLNYNYDFGVLNAKDFGVPQNRARFFVIGTRMNTPLTLPATGNEPPPTVYEAIADLPPLKNGASKSLLAYGENEPSKYAKKLRGKLSKCSNHLVTLNADYIIHRYRYIEIGGNWKNIPDRLMKNYTDHSRCHTGIYYRLRPDSPSVVIGNYRKNMLIHPTQDRGLSVREAARIQSFPDSYEFFGSIGFQQQQVGNAVPPFLAEAVFNQLMGRERQ